MVDDALFRLKERRGRKGDDGGGVLHVSTTSGAHEIDLKADKACAGEREKGRRN